MPAICPFFGSASPKVGGASRAGVGVLRAAPAGNPAGTEAKQERDQMAELNTLEEKLAEVTGLAQAAAIRRPASANLIGNPARWP